MLKNALSILFVMILLATTSAFAENGCKTTKFTGTYTRVDQPTDVFGDGTVTHQYFWTLLINSDGSASQSWTGFLDFPINTGTGTPNIGSWVCRADGKLVVTLLTAGYNPTPPGPNHPLPDVSLIVSQRLTYVFSVDDVNTLTRVHARARNYGAGDDPTNPAGGTLGPLSVATVTYKRFVASDADIFLP